MKSKFQWCQPVGPKNTPLWIQVHQREDGPRENFLAWNLKLAKLDTKEAHRYIYKWGATAENLVNSIVCHFSLQWESKAAYIILPLLQFTLTTILWGGLNWGSVTGKSHPLR